MTGQELKHRRENLGLTQSELAEALSTPSTPVSIVVGAF